MSLFGPQLAAGDGWMLRSCGLPGSEPGLGQMPVAGRVLAAEAPSAGQHPGNRTRALRGGSRFERTCMPPSKRASEGFFVPWGGAGGVRERPGQHASARTRTEDGELPPASCQRFGPGHRCPPSAPRSCWSHLLPGRKSRAPQSSPDRSPGREAVVLWMARPASLTDAQTQTPPAQSVLISLAGRGWGWAPLPLLQFP